MPAAHQFDYFAEEPLYESCVLCIQEILLELDQIFLPAKMNPLKSPRNRVDCMRYSMQFTNKPRKQDDQHFTPRKFNNAKKVRSFSDFNADHFLKHFPSEKLSQNYPKERLLERSVFDQSESMFLNPSSSLFNQSTMTVGSLSSTDDSRPGSSDDSLANRSPIRHPGTNSPDDFGYFRMFEDASVSDVCGAGLARDSCKTFEDLNMNLMKIDLLDVNENYSRRQSPVAQEQLARNPGSVQKDTFNVPLIPWITKELEISKDNYFERRSPARELRPRSPILSKDAPVGASLMPPLSKELQIAKEIEEDGYSGQQSPVNEPQQTGRTYAQSDAHGLSLTKELETVGEIENVRSSDRLSQQTLSYRCGDHPCTQLFYCQTCCKPICRDCATRCALKHVTVDFVEFVENAQRQAEDVLIEAYLGIDVIVDDMENMGLDIAALDQRAREALSDVKFFSRRMWSAVEEREKKLYKQIMEARQWKFDVLHERYMNLKEDKTRLSQAVSALKCAMHDARSSTLACNPDDLLMRKNMVSAEIWQIRQNRKIKARSNREENWISFKSSDSNVLSVIANGGNVMVNSPGTIGDRQPNYKSSQSYFPYGSNEQVMQPIPRGRPIMEYDRSIFLPNRKSDLLARSTDVSILGYFGDNNPDNLCRPWGVTCDNEGNIIVSDRSNNRIQIYRENGTLVRRFGSYGNGPCQFNRPAGIAVDARRRLIVVDKDNHRVQILTLEGEFLRSFGEHGEKQGQFCYPWDVAVNAACEIAVTDTRNHRVQLFSAEGIPLRMFGGQPHMLRYLDSPRGICFNHEGKLIVTDFNNHHVLIIEYNMTEMRILKCEKELRGKRQDGVENGDGSNDENAPAFQRPQGIVAADDGSILVADSRHNAIKAFNSVGSLIYSYKPGQDEMDRPLGVALHWDGRMAFTDYGRNYVRLVRLEHHVDPVPRNAIIFG